MFNTSILIQFTKEKGNIALFKKLQGYEDKVMLCYACGEQTGKEIPQRITKTKQRLKSIIYVYDRFLLYDSTSSSSASIGNIV